MYRNLCFVLAAIALKGRFVVVFGFGVWAGVVLGKWRRAKKGRDV